jgi:hypothetical protein
MGAAARHFNAYRLAAYTLILYALGHTLGAVVQTPQFGPESDAVVSAMKTVHVAAMGADCTWYGFYRGFGIFVSIFFVFSVVMAWHLGRMRAEDRVARRRSSFRSWSRRCSASAASGTCGRGASSRRR